MEITNCTVDMQHRHDCSVCKVDNMDNETYEFHKSTQFHLFNLENHLKCTETVTEEEEEEETRYETPKGKCPPQVAIVPMKKQLEIIEETSDDEEDSIFNDDVNRVINFESDDEMTIVDEPAVEVEVEVEVDDNVVEESSSPTFEEDLLNSSLADLLKEPAFEDSVFKEPDPVIEEPDAVDESPLEADTLAAEALLTVSTPLIIDVTDEVLCCQKGSHENEERFQPYDRVKLVKSAYKNAQANHCRCLTGNNKYLSDIMFDDDTKIVIKSRSKKTKRAKKNNDVRHLEYNVTITFPDGDSISGVLTHHWLTFADDQEEEQEIPKDGFHTYKYPSGLVIECTWKDGEEVDGCQATMTYPNRDTYVGTIQSTDDALIRNGSGTFTYFKSKMKYEGEWEDNKEHGYGKLSGEDGDVFYQGIWRKGKFWEGESSKGPYLNGYLSRKRKASSEEENCDLPVTKKAKISGTIHKNKGGGDCLFRSFAYLIYGDECYHWLVRHACYKKIDDENRNEYLEKEGFKDRYNFGYAADDAEIEALSRIYGCQVHVKEVQKNKEIKYRTHEPIIGQGSTKITLIWTPPGKGCNIGHFEAYTEDVSLFHSDIFDESHRLNPGKFENIILKGYGSKLFDGVDTIDTKKPIVYQNERVKVLEKIFAKRAWLLDDKSQDLICPSSEDPSSFHSYDYYYKVKVGKVETWIHRKLLKNDI